MLLPVYLDHNATTPCDPRVVEAMLPYFTENYGNAASRHHVFGWQAEEAVDYAREQLAAIIGATPQEIVFTSGATESDNLALKGIFERYSVKGRHIITVNTEHKAVLDSCAHMEKLGATVTYLSVKENGLIDLNELEAAIRADTILIAVMYANNETGVIQPIRQISDIARKQGVLFFSDAVQAVGKIPVDVKKDGIDLMAFTAHKIYGPKGIGGLYVSRKDPRVNLIAQMDGGGHERGRRSGTLNVPGIVGFGKAVQLAGMEMDQDIARLEALRNKLEQTLLEIEGVSRNGDPVHRLPHVANLSFDGIDGPQLLTRLNKKGIALSSGSACTSGSTEPSYVLRAMGLEDPLAYSALRFGLGRFNTSEQIDYVIRQVRETVAELRKEMM